MQTRTPRLLRSKVLPCALLIAMAGMLASCNAGSGDATQADTQTDAADAAATQAPQAAASDVQMAPADFEGTMQQLVIMLGPEAITSLAGSKDLAAVLALSPDEVIEAVQDGKVEAKSITRSTLEIDGRMGRLQEAGQTDYIILDGEQMASHMVQPENSMILTMDPAKLAAAAEARGNDTAPMELEIEQIGEREIRGFDATGHRFEFIGDNIATVWLSEELESEVGPIFDVWSELNPLGKMEVGEGASIRSVMVNPETIARGRGFMPAYTITEFYDLQPGDIADERFDLPQGYQRQGMAELGRGAAMPPAQ